MGGLNPQGTGCISNAQTASNGPSTCTRTSATRLLSSPNSLPLTNHTLICSRSPGICSGLVKVANKVVAKAICISLQ